MKAVTLKGIHSVRQYDGHGCGCCAAAAVYRYYGLDTRSHRLRERMGTDSHFLPHGMPGRGSIQRLMLGLGWDTRGTLCPDMFAALHRDGFDISYVSGDYLRYRPLLHRHLVNGHPALALVAGMAHWLAVAGMDNAGVLVLDSSGFCDPRGEGRPRFRLGHGQFRDLACGVVFVKRNKNSRVRDMACVDDAREYARGLDFSLRCLGGALPYWMRQRAEA
ncbi:MAG: hypothetical protein WCK89_10800 [bacterium]